MSDIIQKEFFALVRNRHAVKHFDSNYKLNNQEIMTAKAKGLDSCPIGGFDSDAFNAEFAVPSRYIPILLVAIGKGTVCAHPSSRFPVEQTITWNSFRS
ncbi:hypothetical protein BK126_18425 [Paenibacillus sp. FSL H7-0326]|uniref:nitroreductase family protein n=1 Tax=Paenibacillus sp. FSL H7-0326 TaxID=1921144 RepID=UPI00096ED6A8|nr:nitroreductase family protein [Paenibacillus sp. FSL H7-0326]OMC67550.1 hypothetical protein BK126_18425 [Paenibacillus sp. FSL H7-0326]